MLMLRLRHMWLRLDHLRLFFKITTRDNFMSSQREVEHIASTYMTINALTVRHLYMDFPIYSHIIAACQFRSVDFLSFVQGYYSTHSYYDTWTTLFHPIFNKYERSPYDGPTIMPSESMKHTSRGHPKSTRLHYEMDVIEGKTTITCELCKQPGHNPQSCQNMNQVD